MVWEEEDQDVCQRGFITINPEFDPRIEEPHDLNLKRLGREQRLRYYLKLS